MSKYNKTILTNPGLDLAAKASSGKAKFTITRAATSTEKLADKSISELQQLTALPSLMQYGEINNVADSAQDKSIIIGAELIFNNKDLSNSYNINTIGLFAKEDGVDNEILYAITTASEPETMPDYKDKVLFKFNMTMFVVVGQTDNVTVNVTDNGVVTQEQLASKVTQIDDEIKNIKNSVGKLKQISLNGSTAISPDDNGVANLNVVTKVDGIAPDKDGNVQTDHYTKAESDKRNNDLISRIEIQEKKEIVHHCEDLDSGIAYSKAHPDVFVATP